ncbi:amidohydrolase family protein [Mucilaginibacter sp. KACC 22063]|uniref:amidohydrolase family protein n=1 Tax=Mucilaginibacter sp. KACC 22063 TaxID=3025666 RepID=UPI002365D25F|nr:amidohydrolase family protein [Mucilaginibacter sp. KACC 22063]WDF53806.1 amidohydrolase family protein [Mucilaginibacter sp. KACC 22063]
MLLQNVKILPENKNRDILLSHGIIERVEENGGINTYNIPVIDLDGAVAVPGFINSHDHLDFNLFPRFTGPTYADYVEWGEYIHQHYRAEINDVLKVPPHLRTQWGIYKNLLAGATTVVNHGEPLKIYGSPINVFQDCHHIHSVRLGGKWKRRINNPFDSKHPYVIHTGEGTNALAFEEINELLRWNFLRKKLIGIHGVAMNAQQAAKFDALIWCPDSNFFLLNRTADISQLKQHTNILFGTDSTLTGDWNMWQHLRLAAQTGHLNDAELMNSITTNAAKTWKLNKGKISDGTDADLVILKDRTVDNFYELDPADILLVICNGQVRLYDESLATQLKTKGIIKETFVPVELSNSIKYVEGNLPDLMSQIKSYCPEAKFPIRSVKYAKVY